MTKWAKWAKWLVVGKCVHSRVTFPVRRGRTHMCACLECGEELDYMRLTGAEWLEYRQDGSGR